MAYIYKHIRTDINEVFYIGIGSDTKYKRANTENSRNKHWKNVINKTSYIVEIIEDGLSWEDACKREIEIIKYYGRKDLNEGTLVNMTDGGDGVFGFIMSSETKEKISIANSGKQKSEEHKQKAREAQIGKKRLPFSEKHKHNISQSVKGRPKSEEHKLKLKESKLGNTYWLGKVHSEEAKKKMSEAWKKRTPITEETRLKMSLARKGKRFKIG